MARYLKTAEEAGKQIEKIMSLVEVARIDGALEQSTLVRELAYLYNLGIRTNPRPAQSTVRLRAVQKAVEGWPVKVRMEERGTLDGKPFNALVVETKE